MDEGRAVFEALFPADRIHMPDVEEFFGKDAVEGKSVPDQEHP